MRPSLTVLAALSVPLAACTSTPAPAPLTATTLVGTWTSTPEPGDTLQWSFGADGAYALNATDNTGQLALVESGTYTLAGDQLVTTGTEPGEGSMIFVGESTLFGDAEHMCQDAYQQPSGSSGMVGSWTEVLRQASYPAGTTPPALGTWTDRFSFYSDGTLARDENGTASSGSWWLADNVVTAEAATQPFDGAGDNGQDWGIVDLTLEDNVMCNEVYTPVAAAK